MQFVTAEEIAKVLEVSDKSVYRWAKDGTLPSYRIGRAVRFDLEEVIQRVRQGTEEAG